jgi:hypothetical protein
MRKAILAVLVLAVLGAGWVPPLFTGGACSAEFDALSAQLQGARSEILTLDAAQRYLAAHALRYRLVTAEQCESAPLADVELCPGGALLLGAVPVSNRVCRYYRDSSVRFYLGFNRFSQLVHIQTDMNPYRILKVPGLDTEIYLGR